MMTLTILYNWVNNLTPNGKLWLVSVGLFAIACYVVLSIELPPQTSSNEPTDEDGWEGEE